MKWNESISIDFVNDHIDLKLSIESACKITYIEKEKVKVYIMFKRKKLSCDRMTDGQKAKLIGGWTHVQNHLKIF